MCIDPYEEYRDEKGRFVKGFPGGPGRPRCTFTWFSGEEFRKQYSHILVKEPSPCPNCGGLHYRFNLRLDDKNSFVIRCKCNHCNRERTYYPFKEKWS